MKARRTTAAALTCFLTCFLTCVLSGVLLVGCTAGGSAAPGAAASPGKAPCTGVADDGDRLTQEQATARIGWDALQHGCWDPLNAAAITVTNDGDRPGTFLVTVEFAHTHAGESVPHKVLGTAHVSQVWPGETATSAVSKSHLEAFAGGPAPRTKVRIIRIERIGA